MNYFILRQTYVPRYDLFPANIPPLSGRFQTATILTYIFSGSTPDIPYIPTRTTRCAKGALHLLRLDVPYTMAYFDQIHSAESTHFTVPETSETVSHFFCEYFIYERTRETRHHPLTIAYSHSFLFHHERPCSMAKTRRGSPRVQGSRALSACYATRPCTPSYDI